MTEEEAKTKQCCGPRNVAMAVIGTGIAMSKADVGREPNPCCVASDCMAWRWRQAANPDWKPDNFASWPDNRNPLLRTPYAIDSTTDGYCGLAR